MSTPMTFVKEAAAVTAVLLVAVTLVPAGTGQAGQAASLLASLDTPETVHLLAGGEQEVSVTLTFDTLDTGIATAVASLEGPDGAVAETTLRQESAGGLVWSGAFALPSTTPAGAYTVRAVAEATEGVSGETTGGLEVAPLAAVAVEESMVDFGAGSPNARLGPSSLTLRNVGNIALDTAVTATDLEHEDGAASIGAGGLEFGLDGRALGALGASGPLALGTMAPGEGFVLDVCLQLPSGGQQYLPPGAYRGTVDVDTTQEGSS